MWGVMSYYNPSAFASKLPRYLLAASSARMQGLPLLVVEAVASGAASEVPDESADIVIRVGAPAPLWLKEHLVNLGVRHLPPQCDKVVWLDADILFTNDSWVDEASFALETYDVVQPFSSAIWLTEDATRERLERNASPRLQAERRDFGTATASRWIPLSNILRGHVGFAWCARREVIEDVGLYDRMIVGGGDYVTACGFYGLKEAMLLRAMRVPNLKRDILAWMEQFHTRIRGNIGSVHGNVLHLWHGRRADRQYFQRYQILRDHCFDPRTDVEIGNDDTMILCARKPILIAAIGRYFAQRKEDG